MIEWIGLVWLRRRRRRTKLNWNKIIVISGEREDKNASKREHLGVKTKRIISAK
jgi:hypothetical protein